MTGPPIKVRLFSVLRERLGREEILLDPDDVPDVGTALDHLSDSFPEIGRYRKWIRVAVNRDYAESGHLLVSGDEVALITPVSGG